MFDQSILDAAKQHAVNQFPFESCGLVVGDQYIECVNMAEDPKQSFEIDQDVINPYIMDLSLQAVIHSHPSYVLKEKSCPSKADMISQMSLNVPFGVIDTDGEVVNDPYWWGDFKLDEKILGVNFHHGVDDCYTIIRKWFWQKRGIKLPEIPRDDNWWLTDENLYVNGFEQAGFVKIDKSELQHGDCMLGKIRSGKINHAGVFINDKSEGHFLVLHHLPGRLSARVPAGIYLNRAELFLRYVD